MNNVVKSVLGFVRGTAVGIATQSIYVGADQFVRSLVNEQVKKKNDKLNKKKEPQS